MASFLFRLLRVLIVLGIAAGVAFWLYSSREKPEKKELVRNPPKVRVVKAQSKNESMTVEAFGTVSPRKEVNVAAEVAGRIDYIHPSFREGGLIRPDDLLIRIDQRTFRLDRDAARDQVAQAVADLRYLTQEIENLKADEALARMNMELSRKELNRLKALSKNQFASKTSLDKAEQQYLAAKIQLRSTENRLALTPSTMAQKKAALAMAKTDLGKAELVLEKSEIRSGFEGFVLEKQAEMGEYVNPGQVLGTIYEQDALDVDVRIPLEQLKWIRPLFDDGKLPEAMVTIANFESDDAPSWKARVARVKARIDEKTRTLPITLEIVPSDPGNTNSGNPLVSLRPGTFVKCRITGDTRENIFRIQRYLLRSADTLFVVTEGKLEIRKISVLRKFEDEVFINGGLDEGELIISSPLPGAAAGMPVTVKPGAGDIK
ncbi:MAG: efflux RND transporter periplasmic adaptor subunit [Desulfobacterales bacterium]|nr:efflux RND transporter periplasmic adaptor subunit [Desulfobacterales bacterium]